MRRKRSSEKTKKKKPQCQKKPYRESLVEKPEGGSELPYLR